VDEKYGKEEPMGDIPMEKHVRRWDHAVHGQDNFGNVCGVGLAPASSSHRIPCVYYD
jgi:hypothetical protein